MKKLVKVFAVMMALCICVTPVFAKPSITHNGSIAANEILINGKKVEADKITATFKTNFAETVANKEVVSTIQKMNNEPEKLAEILKSTDTEIQGLNGIKLEELEVLTQVQDLTLIDKTTGQPMKDAKDVTITWEVPNLVKGIGDVKVLHYSVVRNVWELLTPSNIDFATNSITQYFKDLSPVAVVYVPSTSNTTSSQTDKPKTSDTSMILPIAGVCIVSGALIVFLLRRKHENK